MIRKFKILFDKAGEGQGGGGSGYADPSDKSQTPPPSSEEKPTNPAAPETSGDNLDDFGYQTESKADDQGAENKEPGKKEDPKPNVEDEIKNPASGYGVDDETPADDKPVVPPEKPEDKKEDPFPDIKVEGLDDKEALRLKEFAKSHSLTPEATKALLEQRKTEFDSAKAAREQKIKDDEAKISKLKSDWLRELKTDPTFGGENFKKSVFKAEKVLDLMPETKNELTKRGSMLPPYVMKDMAAMYNQLFGQEKLVHGEDSPTPPPPEEKTDSHLDFYKS